MTFDVRAIVLGFLAIVAACTSMPSSPTRTVASTVNIAAGMGAAPHAIVSQIFTADEPPRYSFEILDGSDRVGILDLGDLADIRCANAWASQGPALVYRNDVLVGEARTSPAHLTWFSRAPQISPANPDDYFTEDGEPIPLPYAASSDPLVALVRDLRPPNPSYPITCLTFGPQDLEGAIQVLPALPLLLLRPADNNARANAQQHGGELYDILVVGEPLPLHFEELAAHARVRVRVHTDVGQNYRLITFDMGGPRTRDLGQPRAVGYAGIRGDIVEWKAFEPEQTNSIGGTLCFIADGRRGPVRPGCSSTGYYQP